LLGRISYAFSSVHCAFGKFEFSSFKYEVGIKEGGLTHCNLHPLYPPATYPNPKNHFLCHSFGFPNAITNENPNLLEDEATRHPTLEQGKLSSVFKDKLVSADTDQSPQIHLDLEQTVTEYYSSPRSKVLNGQEKKDDVLTL
jgi:hypothetical protein